MSPFAAPLQAESVDGLSQAPHHEDNDTVDFESMRKVSTAFLLFLLLLFPFSFFFFYLPLSYSSHRVALPSGLLFHTHYGMEHKAYRESASQIGHWPQFFLSAVL